MFIIYIVENYNFKNIWCFNIYKKYNQDSTNVPAESCKDYYLFPQAECPQQYCVLMTVARGLEQGASSRNIHQNIAGYTYRLVKKTKIVLESNTIFVCLDQDLVKHCCSPWRRRFWLGLGLELRNKWMTRLWFHLSLLCVILVGLQLYIIQARTRTQIVVKIIRKWSALSEWLQAILRARGSDQLSKPSTQKLRNRCRLQQLSELHKTNSCSLYIGHPHPTWPPDQCIIHGDSFLAPNHLLLVPELITCHCVNCDDPLAKCALHALYITWNPQS